MKTLRNAVQKRTGPKPYGMVFVKFARADTLKALPTLRTPTNRHLLPCHPLRTPFCQVLPLGLPRLSGQVNRRHAMTLRLSIDDQSNQDQAPVHGAAKAGGC